MDVLKKLTSASDTLRAERKYGKEIISFKPDVLYASLVTNTSALTTRQADSTTALDYRLDQVVPPSQRRELLSVYGDRLEGDFVEELPGIVSWALSVPFEEMRMSSPIPACSFACTNQHRRPCLQQSVRRLDV